MFKVVVGHSNDPDSVEAIAEIIEQCLKSLAGTIPQAGIVFAAMDFEHSVILKKIMQQFPQLELIGGTSSAEISSEMGFQQDSLTLMLFCSDEIEIKAGIGHDVSKNPRNSVKEAISQATSKSYQEESMCLTLIDGLNFSSSKTVEAINQELKGKIPVFGGVTADSLKFTQTYQFYQQEICSDAVVMLIFSGKLLFASRTGNGWHSLSKPKKVTKAQDNILYEVEEKTALEFYKYYLNDSYPSLKYPLAVYEENSDKFYLRVPFDHDAKLGSVQFFANIAEGATVQIMETNVERILTSAQGAMTNALQDYPGTEAAAVMFFSCASRLNILGTKAAAEYQLTSSCFSRTYPYIGFYTFGEIAPLQKDGTTFLHNESAIALVLGTR